jgi:predicted DNA-binding transcriptional regulator AlpA
MASDTPLFACKRSAAKLLDMKPAEFSALVKDGHLPKPRDIGGFKRWDMPELQRIISGEAADGMGDVKW